LGTDLLISRADSTPNDWNGAAGKAHFRRKPVALALAGPGGRNSGRISGKVKPGVDIASGRLSPDGHIGWKALAEPMCTKQGAWAAFAVIWAFTSITENPPPDCTPKPRTATGLGQWRRTG